MLLFFPGTEDDPKIRKSDYKMGKVICGECEVQEECLNFALITEATHGLFGGKTPLERKNLTIRTRLGV